MIFFNWSPTDHFEISVQKPPIGERVTVSSIHRQIRILWEYLMHIVNTNPDGALWRHSVFPSMNVFRFVYIYFWLRWQKYQVFSIQEFNHSISLIDICYCLWEEFFCRLNKIIRRKPYNVKCCTVLCTIGPLKCFFGPLIYPRRKTLSIERK